MKILIGIFFASIIFGGILWLREKKHLEKRRRLKLGIVKAKMTIAETIKNNLFKRIMVSK